MTLWRKDINVKLCINLLRGNPFRNDTSYFYNKKKHHIRYLRGCMSNRASLFCKVEYLAEFFSFMWIITVKKCTKGDKNLIVRGNSNRVHLSVLKIIDSIIERWPFSFL